jgi:hypothetical protein
MIAFIKAKKLDDDLRRHDWAGFAKGYNGAQYAVHNYHGRLAAAFQKWRGIKDTPFTIEDLRARAAHEEAQNAAKPAAPLNVPVPVDKSAAPSTNNTQKIGIGAAILVGLWAVVTFIQDHPVAVFVGIAVAIVIGAVWSFIRKRAPRSPVD